MTKPVSRDEIPMFAPADWNENGVSIQAWLDASPGRRLKDTRFGIRGDVAPQPAVWEDPLVNQVIKMDIATFLVGERHSIKNTAAMVGMAPDEASAIFLSSQVLDEARHFEAFARRMADLGVSPAERELLMERYTVPTMKRFFDLIDEQIDKRSYVGAAIGQNLILEGMAFPVYRYEARYWSYFDPGLSQIIRGAFADEVQHTGYGEAYLRAVVRSNVAERNLVTRLLREFHQVMQEMFQSLIGHYVGLYQAAADEHMHALGEIQIFPQRRMADTSEEEQMQTLLGEVQEEYVRRATAIGVQTA